MPVDWGTLPAEIWLLIFDHVDDVNQLVQCRLVCKAWDPLAEEAMFGQQLIFPNDDMLTGFYNHLVNKPFLGRCIKKIYFENIDMDTIPFRRDLFQMVFTPNIQSVVGMLSDETLEIMLSIAQKSTKRFDKLAYLPLPFVFDKAIHKEIALYFRRTLKELEFNIGEGEDRSQQSDIEFLQPLFNSLDEFESLGSLTLFFYQEIDSFMCLEDILNRCHHLQTLNIAAHLPSNARLNRDEMNKWLERNVSKRTNACELCFSDVLENPQLVEYVVYKYPNAPEVILNAYYLPSPRGNQREIIERCMHAVKNVDIVNLEGWHLNDQKLLQDLVNTMKSKVNNLEVAKEKHSQSDCLAIVRATRYKSRGYTWFRIFISEDQPESVVENIMSWIGVDSYRSI